MFPAPFNSVCVKSLCIYLLFEDFLGNVMTFGLTANCQDWNYCQAFFFFFFWQSMRSLLTDGQRVPREYPHSFPLQRSQDILSPFFCMTVSQNFFFKEFLNSFTHDSVCSSFPHVLKYFYLILCELRFTTQRC